MTNVNRLASFKAKDYVVQMRHGEVYVIKALSAEQAKDIAIIKGFFPIRASKR